jgi:hypothetical protein
MLFKNLLQVTVNITLGKAAGWTAATFGAGYALRVVI